MGVQHSDLPMLTTVAQAAAVLGLSSSAVRRLIEAGRIAHVRIGVKLVRIPRDAILNFIADNTVQPCRDAITAPAFASSKSAAHIISSGPNGAAAASAARALQTSQRLKSLSASSSRPNREAPAPVIRLRS